MKPDTTFNQQELIFFDELTPWTDEQKRFYTNYEENQNCPLYKFIGNNLGRKRLARAAYVAMGNRNHCCGESNFALLGPASVGKTTLVKLFQQTLNIPLVEIHPKAIKKIGDLFNAISDVCTKAKIGLVRYADQNFNYFLPPMIIFIDEVHALDNNIVQSLLKATEKSDNTLILETNELVDTSNVCWIIATTDRGLLFDAFDTRFTKIVLKLYTLEEIAKIIKLNFPEWTMDICELAAKFGGRIPREAIAFAKEMAMEYNMNGGPWDRVAKVVAEENGIDEFGMSYQRLQLLKALGNKGPIARNRLGDVINCKEEELVKFILPPLITNTDDQSAMIVVTSKGYQITEFGMMELDKRNITHKPIEFLLAA